MDEQLQERIGSFAEDGAVAQWPKKAANGFGYDRAGATLQGIGGLHFIVRPINWQDEATEAALRALVAPVEAPATKKAK